MVDRGVSHKSFSALVVSREQHQPTDLGGTAVVENAYLLQQRFGRFYSDSTAFISSGGSSTVASPFELGAGPQLRPAWLVPFPQAN